VRDEVGHHLAICGGLKVTYFSRLLQGGKDCLVVALLWPWNHLAVLWGTDFLGNFLTPCIGMDMFVALNVIFSTALHISGVADCLEPSAAHSVCHLACVTAILYKWAVTGPDGVVQRNRLEADLACLPVGGIITLFLLHCLELSHIGVVTGGDILMPTLLDLLFLHLLHHLDFGDTDRPISLHLSIGEINRPFVIHRLAASDSRSCWGLGIDYYHRHKKDEKVGEMHVGLP